MLPGRNLIYSIWAALRVELPAARRRHMLQFLSGLTLHPSSYGSLLRAMARSVIEAGLVPVRKNAAHDPVELIAAAGAVAIARWDAQPLVGRALWVDLAIRGIAFQQLFGIRTVREVSTSVIRVLEDLTGEGIAVLDTQASVDDHALQLAERIVVGACPASEAAGYALVVNAVPLAQGLLLARAAAYHGALLVFESILKRVPGHTVALEQAAQCCWELGDVTRARGYARRATIRVRPSRTPGSTAYSGSGTTARIPDDQTSAAMWLRAPKCLQS